MTQFDLLIRGGEVVDPGGGNSGRLDVAIRGNRIAAVDENIPTSSARRTIDASGNYVTPGLVDLHTHVYHGCTFWGVHADPVAARSGVTTWLDVGSAGAFNLIGFRNWIAEPAAARIYALINISSIGLTAQTWELANPGHCDVDLCVKLAELHPELVRGIKARIDVNTTGGSIEPLYKAREAADRLGQPLMAHIGIGPPSIGDVLEVLKPGDIITHCFTGHNMRLIDEKGKLLEDVKKAWDMGVVMDIGHGAGSFSFETGEALIAAGHPPDVISSDIHQMSIHGPLFDLPTCMSKFLALGMSLSDVVEAATVRAADAISLGDGIGTLRPGALADVALFALDEGDFTFYDVHMNERKGDRLLRNTTTILNGAELTTQPDPPPAPWIELSEHQQTLRARGHTPGDFASGSQPAGTQ